MSEQYDGPRNEGAGGIDRTPPQDVAAEQSVLGAMLMSKDAIADVVEVLKGRDFYRPAHELIYDAILDLYGRGEPADPVTVADELGKRGEIQRVGGHVYLADLLASVSIAANAGYYAEIVRDKAVLRRLVEASIKIAQMGYQGQGDVTDIVDAAQQTIYEVSEGKTSDDYKPLSVLIEPAIDEIESIANRGGEMSGVPTGFAELDDLTNGLHAGQMIIIAARPAVGKALALDTKLPTPTGWTTMGEVQVGDELLTADGRPTRVVAATEVMEDRPCYRLTFSDGTEIVADAQHEWPLVAGGSCLTSELADQSPLGMSKVGTLNKSFTVSQVVAVNSVPVRCVQIDDPSHLYLASESMVPTHNSTLALDFARAAAIKHKLTTAFFSLEMSQTEIVMRLLSAEAQVPLNHIRGGKMTEEDWARVVRKTPMVSEAPFFIDDSPNLTMMEIRAKARRLKQRHDLKLVIIDYMQLMSSGKKVESRQLEVSEFSRQIKLLAKELEIPVIALSQLNRGPEQRTDKKPMLSDLRESGCLTASTRVLRADTGAEITMGELLESGSTDIPVWSMDEKQQLVPATMTHAFPSGTKPVHRMTMTSGRTIEATANHPFLTWGGWMPLGELAVGTRLATPRSNPEPLSPQHMDEDEIVLLAHLLGDGPFVGRQPIRYASIDEENLKAVGDAASRRFGITPVRDEYAAARVTTLRLPAPYRLTHGRRNPIAAWLDGLGLFGLRSHEKFVPPCVFQAPTEQVRLFLRHIWATDGSVRWDATAGQGRIYYASTSRRLVDDLARLLLRVGIVAWIKVVRKASCRDDHHLIINGAEQQRGFCELIGVHGTRGAHAAKVLEELRNVKPNTNLDTIPVEVWQHVRGELALAGMTHRHFAAAMGTQFCGSTQWKHAPGRARPARVAAVLEDATLAAHAASDVYWDQIASIEPIGEAPVYDATVLGTHNFIADGIVVHNSLEQDADMVILLHRDDVYDKESSRAGEADLIVAKHRNGRTDTVVTAFQGHYSRFVDMQH
ncbi:replicative DNA helicase [Luteococcus sediminum]